MKKVAFLKNFHVSLKNIISLALLSAHAIFMPNDPFIENTLMDIHEYAISMNHGCPFEYF